MASKPCPMPLFNWRKKQRQALVSDPQSMPTTSMSLRPTLPTEKLNNSYTAAEDENDDESLMEMLNNQSTLGEIAINDNNKPGFRQTNQPMEYSERFGQGLPTTSSPYTRCPPVQTSCASTSKSVLHGGTSGGDFIYSNNRFSKGTTFTNHQSHSSNGRDFQRQNNQGSSCLSTSGGRGRGVAVSTRGSGISRTGFQTTFSNKGHVVDVKSNEMAAVCTSYGHGQLQPSSNVRTIHTAGRSFPRETQGYLGNSSVNKPGPVAGSQLKVQSGFGVQKASFNPGGPASRGGNYGNRSTTSINSVASSTSRNDFTAFTRSTGVCKAQDVRRSNTIPTAMEKSVVPKTFPSKKPDSSMRFFTCPISVLRAWSSAQPFDGLIMFEVYGKVISATVADKTETGKEFVIQDDSSSIKCIFYEIDRELPALARGQIHRVVGTFDRKRGVLKAVSVRKASKAEHQVFQNSYQNTMEEMHSLGFLINEP